MKCQAINKGSVSMLSYKTLIQQFVLNGVFVCCVIGASVQPEVGVLCLLVSPSVQRPPNTAPLRCSVYLTGINLAVCPPRWYWVRIQRSIVVVQHTLSAV